jgi:uncharacterized membrane protein (UPF0127 family)
VQRVKYWENKYRGNVMIKNIGTKGLLLVSLTIGSFGDESGYKYLNLSNTSISLKVVSSLKNLRKGLMGVEHLKWNKGMWFDFKEEKVINMWTKGMKIPIDIIFLSKEYKINKILKRVNPCKTPNCTIYSSKNTQYVIELRAGAVDRYKIDNKSKLKIKKGIK